MEQVRKGEVGWSISSSRVWGRWGGLYWVEESRTSEKV